MKFISVEKVHQGAFMAILTSLVITAVLLMVSYYMVIRKYKKI